MCRLFGMTSGAEPTTATFWLLDAPDSLLRQSFREPDGTGIGWFDERGAPHVSKQPLAAHDDKRFVREANEIRSRTFLAHIRFASAGPAARENTHPFEQERRLFAHNGALEGLPALDSELGAALAHVHGQTDSERAFALITKRIDEHGGDVEAGITAAVTWIADQLPLYALNFVLTSADELWASATRRRTSSTCSSARRRGVAPPKPPRDARLLRRGSRTSARRGRQRADG